MKVHILIITATLAFAGCATHSHTVKPIKPAPPTDAAAVPTSPVLPELHSQDDYRTPGVYKAYYIGPSLDPDRNSMREGGDMVVREIPERWRIAHNIHPQFANARVTYGPQLSDPSSALHPDPVPAEYSQALAHAKTYIDSLTAQNRVLSAVNKELSTRQSPVLRTVAAANGAPAPASAPAGRRETTDTAVNASSSADLLTGPLNNEDHELITLIPNSDDLVGLDLALLEQPGIGDPNPFALRFSSKTSTRSLQIKVSSIALGPKPSVTINKRLLGLGEQYEGFTVHTIDLQGIYLRRDSFLVRIPLQEKPITIRLP